MLLCPLAFLGALCYTTARPTASLYARQLGLSYAQVGSLGFAMGLMQTLTAMPLGRLSDRIGKGPAILIALSAMSASCALFPLAGDYRALLAISILLGLSGGGWWPSIASAFGEAAPPRRRGFAMGLYSASFGSAYAIGPFLGGLAINLSGYPAAFALCFASGASGAAIAASLGGEGGRGVRAAPGSPGGLGDPRSLAASCAGAYANGALMGFLFTIFPVYLKALGFSEDRIGAIVMAFGIARTATFLKAGGLGDRHGHSAVAASGLALAAIASAAMGASGGGICIWPSSILLGLALGMVFPSLTAMAAGGGGSGGLRMGAFETAVGIGLFSGPLIGGHLADALAPEASLYFCALVSLASLAALSALSRRGRDPGAAEARGKGL